MKKVTRATRVIRRGGCFTKNEADAQGFECLVKQLLPIFTIVLGFANIDADVYDACASNGAEV